jgi:hypothetical protein
LDRRSKARKKFKHEAHKAHEEDRKLGVAVDRIFEATIGMTHFMISAFFFVRFVRFVF